MKGGTLVFDFDGVIHSYTSGWQGPDVANDPPVDGIKEAIADLRHQGYEIVVVSTRCTTNVGKECVMDYLDKYEIVVDKIVAHKPPALVYIDDRAICFDGHPETLSDKVNNFIPWNKQ